MTYCSAQNADGTPCENKSLARGLCRKHYQKLWNKGQLPARVKKENKNVSFTIRLNQKMHAALAKQRRATGRTFIELIEEAISAHLQRFGLWPPKG